MKDKKIIVDCCAQKYYRCPGAGASPGHRPPPGPNLTAPQGCRPGAATSARPSWDGRQRSLPKMLVSLKFRDWPCRNDEIPGVISMRSPTGVSPCAPYA